MREGEKYIGHVRKDCGHECEGDAILSRDEGVCAWSRLERVPRVAEGLSTSHSGVRELGGSGRDGDGCCEIGIVEGRWEEGSGEEKKTGKRIQASWPLQAKDAFIQKEQDREDVENHSYLNEELPDLLVEVKTSGQSYPDYASDGEELSDEEEQEFYYLNTLGIRHCDRDEKDRVYRFHLSAKECGMYRPGDIVDVEESKVAQAVEAISERGRRD